jgi:hypothetical protein
MFMKNYSMNKILFLCLLLTNTVHAQKLEKYCEVVATGRLFSTKVTIQVDFGEERAFFKDTRMRDDDGAVVKFNTLVDALNYMGTQNWHLVNAFPISSSAGGGKVLHFYFKKEYDTSELATEPKK